MGGLLKKSWIVVFVLALAIGGCTSGDDQEAKYVKIFSDLNKDWALYEIKQQGDMTVIMVEVTDVVPFKEAQKALEQVKKVDPKLKGYIEFYNAEVGMTLRKVEIIP